MNKIIYRLLDLRCVGTVCEGMTIEQEIELNVIPNFGGNYEDYDFIETDKTDFHLERNTEGDVIIVEKGVDLTLLKKEKINNIKVECYNVITNGFNSKVKYGETHRYLLTDLKQSNMQTLIFNISMGMATNVPWSYEGQVVCDVWTADEFRQLYQQATVFGLNQRYKSDILEQYILDKVSTIEELNSISMSYALPTEYQSLLVEKLTAVGCPLWVEE
jgi:hypothetical protein